MTGSREAPTLIATTRAALPDRIDAMRRAGVEVVVLEQADGRVDLRALMVVLGRRGVLSVLVEGGAEVAASALAAGVVDKVVAIVAPWVIGGDAALSPVEGAGPPAAIHLHDVRVQHLDEDVAIEGYLTPAPWREQARHQEA
jgi:diaminohydroxyphosphoribosylaminopyrimidine deaminase/5-amino-6-(5-phosphoribosylamino)uracil reductase